MNVLVLAPTAREARAAGHDALVCGPGEAAVEGAGQAIAQQRPHLVVVAGFGGGLDPSLGAGTAVLCRSAVARQRAELLPEPTTIDRMRKALRARGVPFVSSRLLTVDRVVGTRRAKTVLWNKYGAAAVDMETYPVAQLADAHGIPWVAVRALVDTAGQSLPPSLRRWQGEEDGRVARRALREPFDWPAYVRLAVASRRAERTLGAAVDAIVAAAPRAVVEPLPMVDTVG